MKRPLPTCYGKMYSSVVTYYSPTDNLKCCEVCRAAKACYRKSCPTIRTFCVVMNGDAVALLDNDSARWKRFVRRWKLETPDTILDLIAHWCIKSRCMECKVLVAARTNQLRLKFLVIREPIGSAK